MGRRRYLTPRAYFRDATLVLGKDAGIIRWRWVTGFYVSRTGHAFALVLRKVAYHFIDDDSKQGKIRKLLGKLPSELPSNFGLSASDLALLMNAWRDHHV